MILTELLLPIRSQAGSLPRLNRINAMLLSHKIPLDFSFPVYKHIYTEQFIVPSYCTILYYYVGMNKVDFCYATGYPSSF